MKEFSVQQLQENVKEYQERKVKEQMERVNKWIAQVYEQCEKQSLLGFTICKVEPMELFDDTELAIKTLIKKYNCHPKYTTILASGRVQISWSTK